MQIEIRQYRTHDAAAAAAIWNEVVRGGAAFPQQEELTEENADSFFRSQSFTGLAEDAETGEIVGLYILHPNNVGRCGHICNTSYAVKDGVRGRISANSSCGTAWRRERHSATASSSLMRSSRPTRVRSIFTAGSASSSSASSRAAFSCRTAITRTSFRTITNYKATPHNESCGALRKFRALTLR